ncbi:unnamed protein product [Effrenium voratum]|nr:unnamed protein product [Effrenium voratum]
MILQQVSQIGRGTFSQASCEMDNLVNTFTTLSHTITVTRQIARNERTVRAVAFDSARRYGKTPVFALKRWSEAERVKFTLAHGTLKEVGRKKCLVAMHQNPIMQGAMRVVHHFRDTRKKAPMVAKFSKFVEHDDSLDYVKLFVKNTLQTRMLAQSFQHSGGGLSAQSRPSSRKATAEPTPKARHPQSSRGSAAACVLHSVLRVPRCSQRRAFQRVHRGGVPEGLRGAGLREVDQQPRGDFGAGEQRELRHGAGGLCAFLPGLHAWSNDG